MYSIDFRKQVLRTYLHYKSSRNVASFYQIHHSTVCRWVKRIFPKKRIFRLSSHISVLDQRVKESLDKSPLLSQCELLSYVRSILPHLPLSRRSIAESLRRIRYSRKRVKNKHRVYSHPDPNLVQIIRQTFTQSIHPVICVDESGFADRFARRQGYSPVGIECVIPPKKSSSFRASLLLAISNRGDKYSRILTSSVKSSDFLSFLQTIDSPEGTIIVMDNCSIHKSKIIQSFLLSKRWVGIYLPPYCPDLNPVELCFARLKYLYRKELCKGVLMIEKLLQSITSPFIQKTYRHVDTLLSK